MLCPRCQNVELRPVQYEGVTIDACDSCGGEFLDHDELRHIVEARRQRFDEQARAMMGSFEPVYGVPVRERRSTTCPKCYESMQTINYSGDSGVYVDRCAACGGFWLDGDELEAVQLFQEEWEARAPRKIQEVAAELERVRREQAARLGHAFQFSRFAFVNALINRILDAA